MKNLEKFYKNLEKYKNFDEQENEDKFLDTVSEIVLQKDPDFLTVIISFIDDKTSTFILNAIQKALESFPMKDHVFSILKNLETMLNKAPLWTDEVVTSLLNEASYQKIFRANMHLVPKSSLLELFSIMEKESPHHHELIQELRKELEKS
ncbi:MAG: hypothetical protein ACRCUQ_05240 [Alphaproteobacteria bacterium]